MLWREAKHALMPPVKLGYQQVIRRSLPGLVPGLNGCCVLALLLRWIFVCELRGVRVRVRGVEASCVHAYA